MAAPSTGHGPHDIGREDLPALAAGTETCSFDYRVPVVIAMLLADFACAEPHPKTHGVLLAPVAALHSLLHGHTAGQSSRSRAEDHHKPVAEALHLDATGFGDGLA